MKSQAFKFVELFTAALALSSAIAEEEVEEERRLQDVSLFTVNVGDPPADIPRDGYLRLYGFVDYDPLILHLVNGNIDHHKVTGFYEGNQIHLHAKRTENVKHSAFDAVLWYSKTHNNYYGFIEITDYVSGATLPVKYITGTANYHPDH